MNDENLDLSPTDIEKTSSSPYTQLSGKFGEAEISGSSDEYTVTEANSLIEKLKDMLRKSTTGARLVTLAETRGVRIHLIKSKKLQSATTPDMHLYLAAEAGQITPQMPQVLEFGGALREIEQYLMGYKVPPKDSDPLERANLTHTKMLDKIVYMCKIGIDLESVYSQEVKEAITAFGYEDIYQAQIDALDDEDMKNIYIDATKKVKSEET